MEFTNTIFDLPETLTQVKLKTIANALRDKFYTRCIENGIDSRTVTPEFATEMQYDGSMAITVRARPRTNNGA